MDLEDEISSRTRMKSSESVTEIPLPDHHSGDFGESACGEPLSSQHLVIDFTPTADDTEFVQKKCCAFWDFVMTCPELEQYRVVPEPNITDRKSKSNDIELATIKSEYIRETPEQLKTAVSMLEFVEEKGLITRAFESKLPKSGCSLDLPNYFEDKPNVTEVNEKDEFAAKRACTCKAICKSCKAKTVHDQQPKMTSEKVQEICKEMQDWDLHHPKSMEPPGHPPILN